MDRERLSSQASNALLWKAMEMAGGRGIALVRTLVLARLLAPEDFGLVAIGLISVEVLIHLTNFGLFEALVQAPDLDVRRLDSAWTVELARAVAVAGAVALGAPWIAGHLFGEPRATEIIRALAITPIIDHAGSIGVVALRRSLRFRPLAILNLSGTVTHTVLAISLAPTLGVHAIVIGVLGGALAQTFVSYVVGPHLPRPALQWRSVRPLLRFGRGIFASEVIRVTGDAALQAIIARTLGTTELGYYFLARRVAFLPRELVRGVVGDVAFPLHARLRHEGRRAVRAFQTALLGTLALVAPLSAVGIVLASALVESLAGVDWGQAVPVLRLLTVAGTLGILTDAVTPMLRGRGRPLSAALLLGVRTTTLLACTIPLAGAFGLAGAGLAFILAELAALAASVAVTRRFVRNAFAGVGRGLGAVLTATAAAAAAALLLHRLWPEAHALPLPAIAGLLAGAFVLAGLDRGLGLNLLAALPLPPLPFLRRRDA